MDTKRDTQRAMRHAAGDVLRSWREAAQAPQHAAVPGCGQRVVSAVETGRHRVDAAAVLAFTSAMGRTPADLLRAVADRLEAAA